MYFWKAGWHDFTAHPVVGSGGGSFAKYWSTHRPIKIHILNVHSLYLETLAELGVIGLAILLVALLPPLWTGLHRRAHPLSAPVMAAYIAFLVHTGGDWTWQLPAVGLAAIACGATVIGLVDDPSGSSSRGGRGWPGSCWRRASPRLARGAGERIACGPFPRPG